MADTKITALTAITTVDPAADVLPIVDVSDTSMAASGTTKKITSNQILQAGGTATLASATITGDLTAGGNVGFGTTNLTSISGYNTLKINNATNGAIIDLAQADSYKGRIVGSTGGLQLETSGSLPIILASGGVSQYRIGTLGVFDWYDGAGGTRMTLNSTGLNIANGNVILGTSGKGIDFSATASGSGTMTSELLNDYEEGTFTPVIVGTTAAGVGTYTSQVGRYTKVGRLVSAQFYLNWTAHTGTGNMLISGLPFSSQNVADLYNAAAFGWVSNISLTAGNVITGYVSYNTPFITLEQYPVGGGSSGPVPIDAAGGFIANVSYIA